MLQVYPYTTRPLLPAICTVVPWLSHHVQAGPVPLATQQRMEVLKGDRFPMLVRG